MRLRAALFPATPGAAALDESAPLGGWCLVGIGGAHSRRPARSTHACFLGRLAWDYCFQTHNSVQVLLTILPQSMAAVRHAASSGAGGGDTPRRAGHQLRLLGLFFAITGCFLVYSLIQERLMTLGFGPQHERFEFSLFIILVNRLVCCAVAAAALSLAGSTLRPTAPLTLFGVPSLANVLGSASQYEALKYVSFPLQALAKCAKTVSGGGVRGLSERRQRAACRAGSRPASAD